MKKYQQWAAVFTLALMVSSCVVTFAYADDCAKFASLAERTQEMRQQGVKIEHTPVNQMELDMLNNAFQFPFHHGHQARENTVERFTVMWEQVCRAGWYE